MSPLNFEKSSSTDERLYNRGPEHQDMIAKIAERLKLKFNEKELFSGQAQAEIDNFADQPEAAQMSQKLFDELQTRMSVLRSPGHELAHLLDNLNSALRIFQEYRETLELTEGEKLEVVLACLGHDMGKFFEKKLDKINVKDLSFLAPAIVGRDLEKKKILNLPDNLSLRILYDIFSGSAPETKYRTSDIIHQCDREQLIGSATIARGLSFDVGLGGRDLTIPLEEKFKRRLPIPEASDDRYWLVQYEFYMRNLYNPTSPQGKEIINQKTHSWGMFPSLQAGLSSPCVRW